MSFNPNTIAVSLTFSVEEIERLAVLARRPAREVEKYLQETLNNLKEEFIASALYMAPVESGEN